MKNQLLTSKQVAEYLQVDVETIRRYIRTNKLKAVKLGGRYARIRPNDLEKFVAERIKK